MATLAFDTLAYSKKLQQGGIPREQAEVMATVNADAFKNMAAAQQLATKQDLALVKHDLEIALASTKYEILKWMVTAMIAQTALLVGIIAFLK